MLRLEPLPELGAFGKKIQVQLTCGCVFINHSKKRAKSYRPVCSVARGSWLQVRRPKQEGPVTSGQVSFISMQDTLSFDDVAKPLIRFQAGFSDTAFRIGPRRL